MNRILMIKDLRGWFWKTYPTANQTASLNDLEIKSLLEAAGFEVEITTLSVFDFSRNYQGYYVIYVSSEDYLGGTKNFIEDVLIWLKKSGAVIIPGFEFFRAHHNKVMMELLRKDFHDEQLKTIKCRVYPSSKAVNPASIEYPVVIKSAGGAGSQGVFLARNERELRRSVNRASRLLNGFPYAYLKFSNTIKYLTRKAPVYFNNNEFVIQQFIPNLSGDYKVLVFSDHFFVLRRLNREGDFRASGSGRFTDIPDDQISRVLDFAQLCKKEIGTPHLSLDIGFDGQVCHLIEFQCISFGFKALSLSNHYYQRIDNNWEKTERTLSPEQEFSRALLDFLKPQLNNMTEFE